MVNKYSESVLDLDVYCEFKIRHAHFNIKRNGIRETNSNENVNEFRPGMKLLCSFARAPSDPIVEVSQQSTGVYEGGCK